MCDQINLNLRDLRLVLHTRKPPMTASAFAKKLADTAMKQFEKFHLMREQEPALAAQIRLYWQGIAPFPGVDTAWSAVFVSWCVKQAGATAAEFRFAAAHSRFVNQAIRNQIAGNGVFRGHRVATYPPQVGDILQNNRAGNHFDYDFAQANKSYASHSAIVMEVGTDNKGRYLRTIGGNENDSVGMKEVRLDAKGIVKNGSGLYICVIENLK
jgi:hypothetical protein